MKVPQSYDLLRGPRRALFAALRFGAAPLSPLRVVFFSGSRNMEGPSGPPIARARQLVRQEGVRRPRAPRCPEGPGGRHALAQEGLGAAAGQGSRRRGRPWCRCENSRCRERDRPRCPCLPPARAVSRAGAHDVLGQRFARFGGAGRNTDRCVQAETNVSPLEHVLGQPFVESLRSRKNAMTVWRKQPLIFTRSTVGTWTNRPSRSKPPSRNRPCQ